MFAGPFLLYDDTEFMYYKVPVAAGTRMVEGATTNTCRAAGMEAVCAGTQECLYYTVEEEDMCVFTPVESPCNAHM